jgi:hypothetical protein
MHACMPPQSAPPSQLDFEDTGQFATQFCIFTIVTTVALAMLHQQYMVYWDLEYRKMNVIIDIIMLPQWAFAIQYPIALRTTDNRVAW